MGGFVVTKPKVIDLLIDDDLRYDVSCFAQELRKHGESGCSNPELATKVLPYLKQLFPDLLFVGNRFVVKKGLKKVRARFENNLEQYRNLVKEYEDMLATIDMHISATKSKG